MTQRVSVIDLTDKQAAFVRFFLSGLGVGESALKAGYEHETSGHAALRSPIVQRAIADYRARLIGTEGANLAYRTMIDLMQPSQPPMVRLGAAKAMFAAAGIASAPADKDPDKPLNEMTEAELRAFLDKTEKAIAAGGEPPVITVSPANNAPPSGTTDTVA